jgi:ribosomal protein L22
VEVLAKGKNVKIAPRKVRLVLDVIKGRSVEDSVASCATCAADRAQGRKDPALGGG